MHCSSCRHDLAHLALPAKCPECGHWNAAPHPQSNTTPRLPGWLRLTLIAWFAAAALIPALRLIIELPSRTAYRTAFPDAASNAQAVTMIIGLLLALATLFLRRLDIALFIAGAILFNLLIATSVATA